MREAGNSMSVLPTGERSQEIAISLQSIESSEVNEAVQTDHQKIFMTDSGYNQVLVMIELFTKYAEAVPCITVSAEETCDHLINTWIARHVSPTTFQSDNGTALVGELTKELMRRSEVDQPRIIHKRRAWWKDKVRLYCRCVGCIVPDT